MSAPVATARRPAAARGSMWRWPIALAVLTSVGLVSGLVADGFWDAVSWVALGLPVGVCLWFSLRRR